MNTLGQEARRDFVILEAAWTLGVGLSLLLDSGMPAAVIHRMRDGREYFYIFLLPELREAARHYPPEAPLALALDLHEWGADAQGEESASASGAPAMTVVVNEGVVTGYTHPGVPGVDPTKSPVTATGSTPFENLAPGDILLRRALQADFCGAAVVGDTVPLKVFLVDELHTPAAAGLAVAQPAGRRLDVTIQPRRGFLVDGPARGEIVVGSPSEFTPLVFNLRASEAGESDVRVIVSLAGTILGYIKISGQVMAAGNTVSSWQREEVNHQQPIAAVRVADPDLLLHIEEVDQSGRRGFVLTLSAQDPALNLNLKKYGPIFFQSDPGPYFKELFHGIEGLPNLSSVDQANAASQLEAHGISLFESLFPGEVQELFWSLQNRIRSVFIQSSEPWVPWELCRLTATQNGSKVEGPFLCEAFALTRWLPGMGVKPALHLSNLAVVIPDSSALPYSQPEMQYLLGLASPSCKVARIPARYQELVKALSAGQYDGWHFSGHGAARGADPNKAEMLLDQQETLTPLRIAGAVANLGRATPLVFLNSCQIGASGMALTDIGGWARQFIAAGAGAFIGAQWDIFDRTAFSFATQLYDLLRAGRPVGEAVREARQKVKPAGDSTWLAYTVFAHPMARVS